MLSFLASWLNRLDEHGSIRRLVANAGWLVGERVVNLIVNLGVSVWLARYLGPEDFGALNYAVAIVALFGFIPYLGLDGIVTRRLVERPEDKGELLGTTFGLRVVGGCLAAALVVALTLLSSNGAETKWLAAIIAVGLIFDTSQVVDLWFQSRSASRYSVQARTIGVWLGAALKVAMIIAEAPLWAFAAAIALQSATQALLLARAYTRRGGELIPWSFNPKRARKLLRLSWPLILSSAGALIYTKVDQVMLGEMANLQEVGVYAVAARISEIWYFIPAAIGSSLLPAMVQSKANSPATYTSHLQVMYSSMFWAGTVLAALVAILAQPLIGTLYGVEYAESVAILQVHIWACPFMFMGAVLSRWLVMEDMLFFSLTRNLLGAICNVILNFILIPKFGGVGAAIATLVSYTTATFLACFTDRRTWPAGKMMMRAPFAPLKLIRNLR